MATLRWIGKSQSTAEVDTVTLATYDVTTTYSITINGKTYSTLGTGGTVATTAAALQALVAASTEPEFTEWTWTNTVGSAVITATQNTAGVPGTITSAGTGGTGSATHAVVTANQSPNDADAAINYDSGALPVSTNNLIIDAGAISMWWNLGALSAVTLASLTRRANHTGTIGLPETNPEGYWEYRATEFAISATTMTIEQNSSDGVAALKFNVGSNQTALTINGQGAGSLDSEVMWWRGTHASNVIDCNNASLAIASTSGQVATVATLNADNSTVRCGSGCTLTTVNLLDSTAEFNSSITTLNQYGSNSETFIKLAAAVTTLNVYGGTCAWLSTGNMGTVTVGEGATVDLSQGSGGITVTGTITMNAGATWNDPNGRGTYSGSPSFSLAAGVTLDQVTINVGVGRSYTVV